ncbi:MAG: hypothetical protein U5J82_14370 [Desulfobacterales bacterium]|nr:hypothetical protein [Desulfobacterales bacterium]
MTGDRIGSGRRKRISLMVKEVLKLIKPFPATIGIKQIFASDIVDRSMPIHRIINKLYSQMPSCGTLDPLSRLNLAESTAKFKLTPGAKVLLVKEQLPQIDKILKFYYTTQRIMELLVVHGILEVHRLKFTESPKVTLAVHQKFGERPESPKTKNQKKKKKKFLAEKMTLAVHQTITKKFKIKNFERPFTVTPAKLHGLMER